MQRWRKAEFSKGHKTYSSLPDVPTLLEATHSIRPLSLDWIGNNWVGLKEDSSFRLTGCLLPGWGIVIVSLALVEPTLYMTTAEALWFATLRIFSLYVQFPAATNATQAALWETGGNLTVGSHACLSCWRDGTRTRPLTSFLGECSPYRPHSVLSVLTSEVTGSR